MSDWPGKSREEETIDLGESIEPMTGDEPLVGQNWDMLQAALEFYAGSCECFLSYITRTSIPASWCCQYCGKRHSYWHTKCCKPSFWARLRQAKEAASHVLQRDG